MIYGYTIQKIKTIGHGEFYWDEYYETKEYIHLDTKLFTSKELRDKKLEKSKIKYQTDIICNDVLIITFETDKID